MGTTADKLVYLSDTKVAIHDAIVAKGVSVPVGTTFREYATKIGSISGSLDLNVWSQDYYDAVVQYANDSFVRPSDWIAMPSMTSSDEKIAILVAVQDTDQELYYFKIRGSGSIYIDWGDGSNNTYVSNGSTIECYHKYTYSDTDLTDTSSTLGYKQALIVVTATSGGTITLYDEGAITTATINTQLGGGSYSTSYKYVKPSLEIKCSLPNLSSGANLLFGGSNFIHRTKKITCLNKGSVTSASLMFQNCYDLEIISIDFTGITTFVGAFIDCHSLKTVPTLGSSATGSGVFVTTFQNCYSLITTPSIPALNGSISTMFSGCGSLELLPTLNTTAVTTIQSAFGNCYSLKNINVLDLSNCGTSSGAFSGCSSLKEVSISSHKLTTLTTMFSSCSSLEKVNFGTNVGTGVISIGSVFNSCTSLKTILNMPSTSSATSMASIFNGCASLKIIPSISMASVATAANGASIASGCYNASKVLVPLKFTNSIANAKMSATALNDLFTLLPTVTSQTLTVTGNPGASTCNTSIATAKGWTVTI